jgi:hypothetical protein
MDRITKEALCLIEELHDALKSPSPSLSEIERLFKEITCCLKNEVI